MRRLVIFLLPLCLAGSCAVPQSPPLFSTPPDSSQLSRCAAIFPDRAWQIVHALTFSRPSGETGQLLGVLRLEESSLAVALQSVEGMTLFSARLNDTSPPEVSRALPPFDKAEFAAGLLADIRSIFILPSGPGFTGITTSGAPFCRYQHRDQYTDLQPAKDGSWLLHSYHQGQLTRRIHATPGAPGNGFIFPAQIELAATGNFAYTLRMQLLMAEPIPDK